jgi:hypothetical protein
MHIGSGSIGSAYCQTGKAGMNIGRADQVVADGPISRCV